MKKLFVLLLCMVLLSASLVVAPVAMADEGDFYVVPEGQEIVATVSKYDGQLRKTIDADFVLPYGYKVTVVSRSADDVIISFGGIEGHIATADLAKMTKNDNKALALPEIEVQVKDNTVYRLVGTSMTPSAVNNARLTYLGTYNYDTTAYYAVRMAGSDFVYYAPQAAVDNKVEVEEALHPTTNVVENVDNPATADSSAKKDKEFTWVRFILILGIIVPLITIIFMIIRPKGGRRRRAMREIYDDGDYSDSDYDGIDEV